MRRSRTGTITYGQTEKLDPGPTWIRRYMETAPETGTAWTAEQVNALRIALRSTP